MGKIFSDIGEDGTKIAVYTATRTVRYNGEHKPELADSPYFVNKKHKKNFKNRTSISLFDNQEELGNFDFNQASDYDSYKELVNTLKLPGFKVVDIDQAIEHTLRHGFSIDKGARADPFIPKQLIVMTWDYATFRPVQVELARIMEISTIMLYLNNDNSVLYKRKERFGNTDLASLSKQIYSFQSMRQELLRSNIKHHVRQSSHSLSSLVAPSKISSIRSEVCQLPKNFQECKLAMDMVILLDGSASMGNKGFLKTVGFLKSLVRTFSISNDTTRVGILQYSKDVTIELDLLPRTRVDLFKEITEIKFHQGTTTKTGQGLNHVYNLLHRNRRKNIPATVIVITDGKSYDSVQLAAKRLKQMALIEGGLATFAIGVGDYNEDELKMISNSQPASEHVFKVQEVKQLKTKILADLSSKVCECKPCALAYERAKRCLNMKGNLTEEETIQCEEFQEETVEGTTAIAITDPPLPDLKPCQSGHSGSYRLILNSFNDTDDKFFVSNLKKDEYYQVYDYFYEILDALKIDDTFSVNIQNNYHADTDKKTLLENLKRQQLWSEPFLPGLIQNSDYPASYKGFVFVFTRSPSFSILRYINKLKGWRVNVLIVTNGFSIGDFSEDDEFVKILKAPLVDGSDGVLRRSSQQQIVEFFCQEVETRCTPDDGETIIYGDETVKTDCGTFSCLSFNSVFDDQKKCPEPVIPVCSDPCFKPSLTAFDKCDCPAYECLCDGACTDIMDSFDNSTIIPEFEMCTKINQKLIITGTGSNDCARTGHCECKSPFEADKCPGEDTVCGNGQILVKTSPEIGECCGTYSCECAKCVEYDSSLLTCEFGYEKITKIDDCGCESFSCQPKENICIAKVPNKMCGSCENQIQTFTTVELQVGESYDINCRSCECTNRTDTESDFNEITCVSDYEGICAPCPLGYARDLSEIDPDDPIVPRPKCCGVCLAKKCVVDGKEYDDGEEIDASYKCQIKNGAAFVVMKNLDDVLDEIEPCETCNVPVCADSQELVCNVVIGARCPVCECQEKNCEAEEYYEEN